MDCPYCNESWENESQQYCPNCGKLVSLTVHYNYPSLISMKQVSLLLFTGFFSFIVIFYLFKSFNLFISIEFYQSFISSLVMSYLTYFFFKKSDNNSFNAFFPYFKQFFIIVGILIWFSALWIKIVFGYIMINKAIDYFILGVFTVNYIEGYILGVLIMIYFYYRYNKAREVKKIKVIDLLHEEEEKNNL